eukprot:880817_1
MYRYGPGENGWACGCRGRHGNCGIRLSHRGAPPRTTSTREHAQHELQEELRARNRSNLGQSEEPSKPAQPSPSTAPAASRPPLKPCSLPLHVQFQKLTAEFQMADSERNQLQKDNRRMADRVREMEGLVASQNDAKPSTSMQFQSRVSSSPTSAGLSYLGTTPEDPYLGNTPEDPRLSPHNMAAELSAAIRNYSTSHGTDSLSGPVQSASLYNSALQSSQPAISPNPIESFHSNFDQYNYPATESNQLNRQHQADTRQQHTSAIQNHQSQNDQSQHSMSQNVQSRWGANIGPGSSSIQTGQSAIQPVQPGSYQNQSDNMTDIESSHSEIQQSKPEAQQNQPENRGKSPENMTVDRSTGRGEYQSSAIPTSEKSQNVATSSGGRNMSSVIVID